MTVFLTLAFVAVLGAAMVGFYLGGKWAWAALGVQQRMIETLEQGAIAATLRAGDAETHARYADDLHICAVTECERVKTLLLPGAAVPLDYSLPTAPRRPRIEA